MYCRTTVTSVQVTCSDWTMIPAENLVSAAGGTPTRIAVEVGEGACVCVGGVLVTH